VQRNGQFPISYDWSFVNVPYSDRTGDVAGRTHAHTDRWYLC